MSMQQQHDEAPGHGAYVAALWEYPRLCIALFGVQLHTEAGRRIWDESGIEVEMTAALQGAREDGLLLVRPMQSPDGPVLMQYWRSFDDLGHWARTRPHTRWWRWLVDHSGPDLSFYHELYQARTAEAIYDRGARPVGPALFCTVLPSAEGQGRSRQRQQRYAEATEPTPDQARDA
jgi:hypothetical protein